MSKNNFSDISPLPRGVCVFCASSDVVEQDYKALARAMGGLAAREGWHLVYGGAIGGLMGAAADAALEGGGAVTGVMPDVLIGMERAHTGLTTLHKTRDMHERQKLMAALSEAFVILPGGVGTLTEFFEILTWKQIGLHNKPIAMINMNGYWDPMLSMISRAQDQGFMHKDADKLFRVFERLDDLKGFFNFQ